MKWIPILLVALLAGCLGDDATESGDSDLVTGDPDEQSEHGDMNETVQMPAPELSFTATNLTGQAPFNVTFDIAVDPMTNGTYFLSFGDNTSAEGDMLPANHTHSYGAGNFTATVVFTYEGGEVEASLNVSVAQVNIVIEDDGMCHAPDAQSIGGALYVHDRGASGGTWIYEESNGVPGMQLSADPSVLDEYDSLGAGCVNGDTLIF